MKRKFKGYMAALLVLVLSVLSGCGADTATTMHLEKFLGTVGVEDGEDARLEAREGMQLYSGYEVGTAQESQAWIGLDQHKAVKLAELSTGEVFQEGKHLTLKLHEGKLFFNVSKPLEADETLTIETATMITGIRGTSGWVEVVDDTTVRLALLEGSVEVTSTHPETGEDRTATVTGGQILTVVYQGDGREDDTIDGMIAQGIIDPEDVIHADTGLRIEELQEEKVPEFVAEEVAASPELQEKIQEKSNMNVPQILEKGEPQAQEREYEAETQPETTQSAEETVPETEETTAPTIAETQPPKNTPDAGTGADTTMEPTEPPEPEITDEPDTVPEGSTDGAEAAAPDVSTEDSTPEDEAAEDVPVIEAEPEEIPPAETILEEESPPMEEIAEEPAPPVEEAPVSSESETTTNDQTTADTSATDAGVGSYSEPEDSEPATNENADG